MIKGKPHIHERRHVTVNLEPGITMLTLNGNNPIEAYKVELDYDLADGRVISVVVAGWRVDAPHNKLLYRRTHDDYVYYEWLRKIVSKFKPAGSAR